MKDRHHEESAQARQAVSAADWYVERDRRVLADADDRKFAEWMAEDREHAAAFARSEASVFLTSKLRERGRLAWAFEEAASIAGAARTRDRASGPLAWIRRPAFAWSITVLSVALAFTTLMLRPASEQAPTTAAQTDTPPDSPPTARAVIESPVYVLPGDVFVDPRSVAVLPFTNLGPAEPDSGIDANALAAQLYEAVLRRLESIPGMYVVGAQAVEPYTGGSVSTIDMATQLGVRSIVQGRLQTDRGRVQVFVSVIDVASNARLTDESFDRPMSELSEIDFDIANNIALVLDNSDPTELIDNL